MKRLIAAIIAISYLCLSTGFTLHVHYCMGKRVGASLLKSNEEHKCSHCGMTKKASKKGCCHDEYKIVSAKSEAGFITQAHQAHAAPLALLPAPSYSVVAGDGTFISRPIKTSGSPHGPPIATALRLHVRNCSFLI